MKQPINLKTTILTLTNSIGPTMAGRGFLVAALACFALSPTPKAFAVTPPPDGGYPNQNTAEGTDALLSLTSGSQNTATGFDALFKNTTGSQNTANGVSALYSNTGGNDNTAIGFEALFSNTTGSFNTATGEGALQFNTTGSFNTATGEGALLVNITGHDNTATGDAALINNRTGSFNTATGSLALGTIGNNNTATGYAALCGGCTSEIIATGNNNTATGANALISNNANNNTATGANALISNIAGNNNTASGGKALLNNTSGSSNTAEGFQALARNSTGSNNIALGSNAGVNLTTGSNNIDIGASGIAGESNTIRIGKAAVQTTAYMQGISGATVASGVAVIVDTKGHLGTVQSSARFKDAIKPMDRASEAILALKPVTFHYKKEFDPERIPQFGLVAEQVEKVNPDLVVRDEDGKVNTVRYEAVNAMLLNEFLKEHRKVEELETIVAQQRQESQAQRDEINALSATVKEQASQMNKVNARLEASGPLSASRANNQ